MTGYRILEPIGKGATGTVYRAIQEGLDREVAVKLFADDDRFNAARFSREIKACAALKHPNIIEIYDHGMIRGCHFFSMELIDGSTLERVMALQPRLPVPRLLHLARQALDAVAAFHEAGFIHRDLKPTNMMVSDRDHLTVMDLGLVRHDSSTILTSPEETMGTPLYMAPEVFKGEEPDRRSDIYALGLVFYELAVGRRAIRFKNLRDLVEKVVHEEPTPVRRERRDFPGALDALLLRMLSKDPARRPGSREALDEIIVLARSAPDPHEAVAKEPGEGPATTRSGRGPTREHLSSRVRPGLRLLGFLLGVAALSTFLRSGREIEDSPRRGESVHALAPRVTPEDGEALIERVESIRARAKYGAGTGFLGERRPVVNGEDLAPDLFKVVGDFKDLVHSSDEAGLSGPIWFELERAGSLIIEGIDWLTEGGRHRGLARSLDPLRRILQSGSGGPHRLAVKASLVPQIDLVLEETLAGHQHRAESMTEALELVVESDPDWAQGCEGLRHRLRWSTVAAREWDRSILLGGRQQETPPLAGAMRVRLGAISLAPILLDHLRSRTCPPPILHLSGWDLLENCGELLETGALDKEQRGIAIRTMDGAWPLVDLGRLSRIQEKKARRWLGVMERSIEELAIEPRSTRPGALIMELDRSSRSRSSASGGQSTHPVPEARMDIR